MFLSSWRGSDPVGSATTLRAFNHNQNALKLGRPGSPARTTLVRNPIIKNGLDQEPSPAHLLSQVSQNLGRPSGFAVTFHITQNQYTMTAGFQDAIHLLKANSHLGQVNLRIGRQCAIQFLPISAPQEPKVF